MSEEVLRSPLDACDVIEALSVVGNVFEVLSKVVQYFCDKCL